MGPEESQIPFYCLAIKKKEVLPDNPTFSLVPGNLRNLNIF